MRQILDRVIPSDDSHTIISEKQVCSIEVIPKNLMTFRVPSKNACSPAKFIIKYNNSTDDYDGKIANLGAKQRKLKQELAQNKNDLRIYVSQEDKIPNQGLCDAQYFMDCTFFVYGGNNKEAKSFDNNSNIYISFYS